MDENKVMALLNAPMGFATDLQLPTITEMLRRGITSTVEKDQFVTRRGQKEPRLCIMLEGSVRLTAFTEDGREMLTHIVRPGDCWGVHPCLGNYDETNDAVAETPGKVLSLTPNVVDDMMWRHHDFQKELVGLLCRRLNLAISLAEQLGSWTARERVVWRLLLLAGALDGNVTQADLKEITTSQETLASMVHLARQSTNAILRDLAKEGILVLKYGRIEISDLEQLRGQLSRAR